MKDTYKRSVAKEGPDSFSIQSTCELRGLGKKQCEVLILPMQGTRGDKILHCIYSPLI